MEEHLAYSSNIYRFNPRHKRTIDHIISFYADFCDDAQDNIMKGRGYRRIKSFVKHTLEYHHFRAERTKAWMLRKMDRGVAIVYPDQETEPQLDQIIGLTNDFRALVEKYKKVRFVLIGHGYGGDLATLMALEAMQVQRNYVVYAFNATKYEYHNSHHYLTRDNPNIHHYVIRDNPNVQLYSNRDEVYEKLIGTDNPHDIKQFY